MKFKHSEIGEERILDGETNVKKGWRVRRKSSQDLEKRKVQFD